MNLDVPETGVILVALKKHNQAVQTLTRQKWLQMGVILSSCLIHTTLL